MEKGSDVRVLVGAAEKKRASTPGDALSTGASLGSGAGKPAVAESEIITGRKLWDIDDVWQHISSQRGKLGS
jgi:hypothetical protein